MSTITTPSDQVGTRFRGASLWFAAVIPVTVLGFWETYLGILGNFPEGMTAVVHVHALLMFVWLLMPIAQAWFIRTMRYRLHRWVGRSSFVLVPVIIASGLLTTHAFFNKPLPPEEELDVRALDLITLGQLVAFGLTWALAMVHRRNPPIHVRYIVSTLFAIGNAVVFRIFLIWVPGFDSIRNATAANGTVLLLLLFVLIGLDWRRGIKRSPYWVVTLILAFLHLGYFTFARTAGWLSFCHWFAALGR